MIDRVPEAHDGAPACDVRATLLHPDLAVLRISALPHRMPMERVREAHGKRGDDRNASSWIQVMDP